MKKARVLTDLQKQELRDHKYIFHDDPGHGWLQVPLGHLVMLGIEKEITGFSYLDNQFAYLEEDLDFGTFVKGYAAALSVEMKTFKPKFESNYTADSPIRQKTRYSVDGVRNRMRRLSANALVSRINRQSDRGMPKRNRL